MHRAHTQPAISMPLCVKSGDECAQLAVPKWLRLVYTDSRPAVRASSQRAMRNQGVSLTTQRRGWRRGGYKKSSLSAR
jgi:hypothetical protein